MSEKATHTDQSELIEQLQSALFKARFMGQSDDYFFQVAAPLNALLNNLYGKRSNDWPSMADGDGPILASVMAQTGRGLVGISARDVTLDMTRGKKGRILNVDVDRKEPD